MRVRRGIVFAKEDFICPITQEIFFDPAATSPCGHPFERTAIGKHLLTNQNCPVCKTEVINISEVQPLFREVFEKCLKKNPDWQKERYFSIELFKHEIKCENTANSTNRVRTIINHLQLLPDSLNKPDSTKRINLLLQICKYKASNLFFQYPELINLITEEGLNLIDECGNSALTWIASDSSNNQVFFNNKQFYKLINSQGINTTDIDNKDSAVFWLMQENSYLFAENSDLINLINVAGLNTISYQTENCRGTSALFWLIKHDYQLLRQNKQLQSLINYEGLLGSTKINKGKEPSQWQFINPDELKKLIEEMIEKNRGLDFLLDVFKEVIKKELPSTTIKRLNEEKAKFIKENKTRRRNHAENEDEIQSSTGNESTTNTATRTGYTELNFFADTSVTDSAPRSEVRRMNRLGGMTIVT